MDLLNIFRMNDIWANDWNVALIRHFAFIVISHRTMVSSAGMNYSRMMNHPLL